MILTARKLSIEPKMVIQDTISRAWCCQEERKLWASELYLPNAAVLQHNAARPLSTQNVASGSITDASCLLQSCPWKVREMC